MASLAHLAVWCGYDLVKGGIALSATATTKAALALGEVLHKSPLFEHTSKPD